MKIKKFNEYKINEEYSEVKDESINEGRLFNIGPLTVLVDPLKVSNQTSIMYGFNRANENEKIVEGHISKEEVKSLFIKALDNFESEVNRGFDSFKSVVNEEMENHHAKFIIEFWNESNSDYLPSEDDIDDALDNSHGIIDEANEWSVMRKYD